MLHIPLLAMPQKGCLGSLNSNALNGYFAVPHSYHIGLPHSALGECPTPMV